jgi:DNA-binding IclR family transcriptional regulator
MELTSLGRAYLAIAPPAHRRALMACFKKRRAAQWPALALEIEQAMGQVRDEGFCAASWQPEVVAVAAPLPALDAAYVLNVSVSTPEGMDAVVPRLAPVLSALVGRVRARLAMREPDR